MRVTKKRVGIALMFLIVVAIGSGWLWYVRTYPYGWSHSCDKGLWFALTEYADGHEGDFPTGEATPEASLSLLYPKYANASVLQGKTVPLETVQAILDRGDRLGPDTCGWHYVEGLRKDDDPRLALCWDKVGLGHNGERRDDGGHNVIFVGTSPEYIEGSRWESFLQEQETLRKERGKARKQKGQQNEPDNVAPPPRPIR